MKKVNKNVEWTYESGASAWHTWKRPNAHADQVVKQACLPPMSESQGNIAIIGTAWERKIRAKPGYVNKNKVNRQTWQRIHAHKRYETGKTRPKIKTYLESKW